jgi:hypothetical protein
MKSAFRLYPAGRSEDESRGCPNNPTRPDTPKPREISGTMPGSPSLQTGAQTGRRLARVANWGSASPLYLRWPRRNDHGAARHRLSKRIARVSSES